MQRFKISTKWKLSVKTSLFSGMGGREQTNVKTLPNDKVLQLGGAEGTGVSPQNVRAKSQKHHKGDSERATNN